MTERKYTEQEMAEIVRRAGEQTAAAGQTFSLEEMQRIGEEVGLTPEAIARAAALPVASPPVPSSALFGPAGTVEASQLVAGQFDRTQVAEILDVLRTRFGEVGKVSEVAGTVEWSFDNGFVAGVATIAPHADGTVVRLSGQAHGNQVVLYGGALLASLFVGIAGAPEAPLLNHLLTGLAAAVPLVGSARFWWGRWATKWHERLRRTTDEVAGVIERK